MNGALAVLQAHVAEYEFEGEIAEAVAAFAELLAAADLLQSKLPQTSSEAHFHAREELRGLRAALFACGY